MSSLAHLKRPTLGSLLIQARNQQARIEALTQTLETTQAYAVGQQQKVAELTAQLIEERAKSSALVAAAQRPEL